jgi:hypothetical protein
MAMTKMVLALALGSLLLLVRPAGAAEPQWTPGLWVDEDTVELRTTEPGKPPYWFKVWVAVVDDQLYVRLGSRATKRIESNTTGPEIAVRIAGEEFEHVKVENAPEMKERVADELAEKYWSDLLIRFAPHPLTLRLVPK